MKSRIKKSFIVILGLVMILATPASASTIRLVDRPYTLTAPSFEGRLTYSDDGKTATLFAPNTSKEGGWYDVNKLFDGKDGHLCWAASDSNLLAWYLDTTEKTGSVDVSKYERKAENIFEKFRKNWNPNEGYDPMQGLSWYFTGKTTDGKKPDELLVPKSGGYLKTLPHCDNSWSVLDTNYIEIIGNYKDQFPFIDDKNGSYFENAPFYSLESFSKTIKNQLAYGATVLNVSQENVGATGSHAITLWGCDFDVKTGLINKIYVTDSDDEETYPGAHLKELGIKARKPDEKGILVEDYYLPGNPDPITKITSSMLLYASGVVNNENNETEKPPVINNELRGNILINNSSPFVGDVLNATILNSNNTGKLTYTWKAGHIVLGTGNTYTVKENDIGKKIKCFVKSSVETGEIESFSTNPVRSHTLIKVPAVAATCTSTGNIEYWQCEYHGKKFTNSKGDKEITGSVITPMVPHHISKDWKNNEDKHWHVCTAGGEKVQEASHTLKWVIDREATTTDKGSMHQECVVCKFKKPEVDIDMLPAPTYSVVEGGNKIYNPLDKKVVISFKVSDKGNGIKDIYVDDTLVSSDNYHVKYGTNIVFKNEYMANLADGDHSLTINFKDNGKASTNFGIHKEKELIGWTTINGKKYYYKKGQALTGWFKVEGKWYYGDQTGAIQTGWLYLDNTYYYLNEDGSRVTGWFEVDGQRYYSDAKGAMQKGWLHLNKKWYYLTESGAVAKGWFLVDGTYYYADENGVMQTGWIYQYDTYYYLTESGAMAKGWFLVDGKYYYADHTGAMKKGWIYQYNTYYYLTESGAMAKGWFMDNGKYYYSDATGAMVTGSHLIDNTWYYFDESGAMI